MATPNAPGLSSLVVMEEDLTCTICYNLFKDPKDLDCPHVYCLQCLQNWVGNRPTIECPECRSETIVPNGGLVYLKTNLRLRNMVEKYLAHGERRKSVPKCKIHDGEAKHFFCVTCEAAVCRACLVINHERPHHAIRNISDVARGKKENANSLLSEVKRRLRAYEDKKSSLSETVKEVENYKGIEHKKIDQRIQTIIHDAQAKGNAMKLRVTRNCERQQKYFEEQICSLETQVQRLNDACIATQKIITDTEDHEYVTNHKSVVEQMQTALVFSKQQAMPFIPATCCTFHPGPSIRETHLVGHLSVKLKLQYLTEFGTGSCRKVQGIASNAEGTLVVADSSCGRVSVHQFEKGEYKRKHCLGSSKNPPGKLSNPSDVAVGCNDRVYVTDRSKSVVNTYVPAGYFDISFATIHCQCMAVQSNRSRPSCLATAPNGMVVVGDFIWNAITVHEANGELSRTLHIRCKGINQIATNGRQIAYVKTEVGKVFVIDFESGKDVLEVEVDYPTSACFDDNSGSLLIGRGPTPGSGVIDQYCLMTKKHLNRLADDLFMPLAMAITPDNRLAVADCSSVKVYNLIT